MRVARVSQPRGFGANVCAQTCAIQERSVLRKTKSLMLLVAWLEEISPHKQHGYRQRAYRISISQYFEIVLLLMFDT